MHRAETTPTPESGAPSPEKERAIFMEQVLMVPAPMELYALWVDTYRSQQDPKRVSAKTSSEKDTMKSIIGVNKSSSMYLTRVKSGGMAERYHDLNISLPTRGHPGLTIPDLKDLRILYLPDLVPLGHLEEYEDKAGRLTTHRLSEELFDAYEFLAKPKSFPNTRLFTLALDNSGTHLVAMNSGDSLGMISPEAFDFIGTRQFKKARKDLIRLLSSARHSSFSPRPNLERIPGVGRSRLDKCNLEFRDPHYPSETRGFYHSNYEGSRDHISSSHIGYILSDDVVGELKKFGFKVKEQEAIAEVEPEPTLEVLPPKRDHEREAYGICEVAWDHQLKTAAHIVADVFIYGIDVLSSPDVALPEHAIAELKNLAGIVTSKNDIRYRDFATDLTAFIGKAEEAQASLSSDLNLRCVSVYDPQTPDIIFPSHPSGNDEHFYNQEGALHKDDGPAVVLQDGTRIWYKNGQPHRDIGYAKYLPPFSAFNPTAEARFEFWKEGKLHHTNPDNPTIWGENGDRIWGALNSPQRRRTDMPVSVLQGRKIYKASNIVTKVTEPRLPESKQAFMRSLRGRTGFLKLTLQETIDLQRWESNERRAIERAQNINRLGRQAIKNS